MRKKMEEEKWWCRMEGIVEGRKKLRGGEVGGSMYASAVLENHASALIVPASFKAIHERGTEGVNRGSSGRLNSTPGRKRRKKGGKRVCSCSFWNSRSRGVRVRTCSSSNTLCSVTTWKLSALHFYICSIEIVKVAEYRQILHRITLKDMLLLTRYFSH